MNKKFNILLVIILASIQLSFAQVNIGINDNCINYNQALLSKILIGKIGEDGWSWLMDNRISMRLSLKVDSIGNVLDLARFSLSKGSISDSLINEFIFELKENQVRFFICYINDTNIPDKEYLQMIRRNIRKEYSNQNFLVIHIIIPGYNWFYDYERINKLTPISKFDFYLMKMKESLENYELIKMK